MNERIEWAADWDRFEEIAKKWDKMNHKYGDHGLAEMISKTKSYRAYDQRWPFDYMMRWGDNVGLDNVNLTSELSSVEDEVADKIEFERRFEQLSDKQKLIYDALRSGQDSIQIQTDQGYNSNGAVRWHKHQIKKVMTAPDEHVFEFVCRECGNIFESLEIEPECECGSKDCLFTKHY